MDLKSTNCWNADEIGQIPIDMTGKSKLYGIKNDNMIISQAKDNFNYKNHRITCIIFANAARKVGMIAYIIKASKNSNDVILPPPMHGINTRDSIF